VALKKLLLHYLLIKLKIHHKNKYSNQWRSWDLIKRGTPRRIWDLIERKTNLENLQNKIFCSILFNTMLSIAFVLQERDVNSKPP